MEHRELVLRHQPHIYKDRAEPFPIRLIGCTVFTRRERSGSFPKWEIDPEALGAAAVIEYAIYYDYDIQHLYDLEHIWVAVDCEGGVLDCWCSFHGMRLRAAGLASFRLEGTHPVLYAQPGKHAMLPSPELFELHPQFHTACSAGAGGGLLIPQMLADRMTTNAAQDEKIANYIRSRFAFVPAMDFEREVLSDSQFVDLPELFDRIPGLVREQLQRID